MSKKVPPHPRGGGSGGLISGAKMGLTPVPTTTSPATATANAKPTPTSNSASQKPANPTQPKVPAPTPPPATAAAASTAGASAAAAASPIDDTVAIDTKLTAVRQALADLQRLGAIHLSDNNAKSQSKLDKRNKEVVILVKEAQGLIDRYERETKINRSLSKQEKSGREATVKNYREQLIEIGTAIVQAREDHERAVTDAVASRLKVRHNDLEDARAQELAVAVVKSRREDQIFLLARAELETALEIHREAAAIESGMRELRELIQHLNQMVKVQSEVLDEAKAAQKRGHDDIVKGNEYMQAAADMKCAVQ